MFLKTISYFRRFREWRQKRGDALRPSGRSGWMMDSLLISPDGKWITYNIPLKTSPGESYQGTRGEFHSFWVDNPTRRGALVAVRACSDAGGTSLNFRDECFRAGRFRGTHLHARER